MNRRRLLTTFLAVATTVSTVLVPTTPAAARRMPPTATGPHSGPAPLRASEILRPALLSGGNYEIAEEVRLNGRRLLFRVRTPWGVLKADGLNVLRVRLQELKAIERARRLAGQPQFVDGVLESVSQTPRGVAGLLTDPLTSVLSVPEGLQRTLSSNLHPADRRAGSLTRRRIAWRIGCDPETANPVLRRLLDNLAARKGMGQLAGKVGLSAAVPGLGLVPLSAEMRQKVALALPHEINEALDDELAEMGVDGGARRRLLASPHFTTLQRLAYVRLLKKLTGVDRAPQLLAERAARAGSEAEALARLDELRMLGDLREQGTITRLVRADPPTAVLEDGTRVAVLSADYLLAAPRLTERLVSDERGGTGLVVRCSGRASPAFRRALAAEGVRLLVER